MTEPVKNIAAVVVLFNPKEDAIANILSFATQVDRVFAVDNSNTPSAHVINAIKQLENVKYVDNGGNRGIAHALNAGAVQALRSGYKYLLTMDQDTHLPDSFVQRLVKGFASENSGKVGLVAPRYVDDIEGMPDSEEILVTMTSGNILALKAFESVGPFMEELFIDHVDHEYCLRLWEKGFKVLQLNTIRIIHRPGTMVKLNVLGKKVTFSSHSPTRLYYFCRNGFYVSKLYKQQFPQFTRRFHVLLRKEIIKIVFERDRLLRIRRIVQGCRDSKKGIMGPLKAKSH